MRPDPMETARKCLAERFPDCLGAFVGGSIFRNEGTETSDIDVVVLYDNTFDDVHRASTIVDAWPIELFVHSIEAQDYFLEQDRRRGMCVMPHLLTSSAMIPGPCPELLEQRRKAEQIVENGPPLLSSADLDRRRYLLTNLLDDLIGAPSISIRNAVLANLYGELGDFHLRASGKWSGQGKALLRCLKNADGSLATRYEDVFTMAFASDGLEVPGVISLVDEALAPHGGRLWEGYEDRAHPKWRE